MITQKYDNVVFPVKKISRIEKFNREMTNDPVKREFYLKILEKEDGIQNQTWKEKLAVRKLGKLKETVRQVVDIACAMEPAELYSENQKNQAVSGFVATLAKEVMPNVRSKDDLREVRASIIASSIVAIGASLLFAARYKLEKIAPFVVASMMVAEVIYIINKVVNYRKQIKSRNLWEYKLLARHHLAGREWAGECHGMVITPEIAKQYKAILAGVLYDSVHYEKWPTWEKGSGFNHVWSGLLTFTYMRAPTLFNKKLAYDKKFLKMVQDINKAYQMIPEELANSFQIEICTRSNNGIINEIGKAAVEHVQFTHLRGWKSPKEVSRLWKEERERFAPAEVEKQIVGLLTEMAQKMGLKQND